MKTGNIKNAPKSHSKYSHFRMVPPKMCPRFPLLATVHWQFHSLDGDTGRERQCEGMFLAQGNYKI